MKRVKEAARVAAELNGDGHYISERPCIHGCQENRRFTINARCVQCVYKIHARWVAKQPKQVKQKLQEHSVKARAKKKKKTSAALKTNILSDAKRRARNKDRSTAIQSTPFHYEYRDGQRIMVYEAQPIPMRNSAYLRDLSE